MIGGSSLGPVFELENALRDRKLTIAVAESCTGGLLAAALTDLPGSSEFFLGGVVTYANQAKEGLLGVPTELLRQHGAVSAPVAQVMAEAAAQIFGADVGVGVTGIAGPDSEGEKPVGLTYIAATYGGSTSTREYHWNGGRASNRVASVEAALQLATAILS
jgi:nicotinamide-nucleotide amidase